MAGITHVASDPHIKHLKIFKDRGFETIEEHDKYVAHSIFKGVRNRDTLYILGDCCFGTPEEFKEAMIKGYIAAQADFGTKIEYNENFRLVDHLTIKVAQGNHDKTSYLLKLVELGVISSFAATYEKKVGKIKVVLSHIPLIMDRWEVNVHGHLHSDVVNLPIDYTKIPDPRYKCVSWEQYRGSIVLKDLIEQQNTNYQSYFKKQ